MVRTSETVGITTTVPVEVIYAAGFVPCDLNNVFITDPDPLALIADAHEHGFPANMCAWIKGIYGTCRKLGIRRLVGVSEGDCSNTHALLEVLSTEGVDVIGFGYPYDRDAAELARRIERFARRFGTTLDEAERARAPLNEARRIAHAIDELTWRDGKVSGSENHLWLIRTSDFGGDPARYVREAAAFLQEARSRPPSPGGVRLGLIGIPPIADDLYDRLERLGARIVFNEFQRQFSMPALNLSLVQQYAHYTYPYDVFFRVADIRREVARRNLVGLVHYVQSFCFRRVQDRIIRELLDVPILTVEFDTPGPVDARTMTRLEAFIEMLQTKARVGTGRGLRPTGGAR